MKRCSDYKCSEYGCDARASHIVAGVPTCAEHREGFFRAALKLEEMRRPTPKRNVRS